MNRKYFKLLFLMVLFVRPSVCRAEDSSAILERLNQLENEISTLKAELKKSKAIPAQRVTPTEEAKVDNSRLTEPEAIDEDLFKPQLSSKNSSTKSKEALAKRIKDLGQFGITYRSEGVSLDSMRLGAYGETVLGRKESGNGWKNGFDANRLVLLGTYPISEDIIFNTELEFEHGGIAKDADDKLNGAIEVEQLFVDFMANDYLNFRSPGVDVVPMGYVGLFHEPTQYYSTNRPEIYDGLIPSTWFAPATSVYGKITDSLNYQFQISSAMVDAGTVAEDEDGNVPQGGYDPGISGTDALSLGRSPIGDRTQLSNNLAYALRTSYSPSIIPGLSGSTSIYYTNDTTARGAYGTNPNGSTRLLGKSDLAMFDTELRYRIPNTGLELRSEYVNTSFGDTDNLRANNDRDSTNNVGSSMYGYSFEAAYHIPLLAGKVANWEFVPFYRYSRINLQTSGVRGSDADVRSGAGSRRYNTIGAALFPTPKVVLKLDYQLVEDDDNKSPLERALLAGVGFFF